MREVLSWYQGGVLHVHWECARWGCGGRLQTAVCLDETACLGRCVPYAPADENA